MAKHRTLTCGQCGFRLCIRFGLVQMSLAEGSYNQHATLVFTLRMISSLDGLVTTLYDSETFWKSISWDSSDFPPSPLMKLHLSLSAFESAELLTWAHEQHFPDGSGETLFGCTYSKFCGRRLCMRCRFFPLSAMKQKQLCCPIWSGGLD